MPVPIDLFTKDWDTNPDSKSYDVVQVDGSPLESSVGLAKATLKQLPQRTVMLDTPSPEPAEVCPLCQTAFETKEALNQHFQSSHEPYGICEEVEFVRKGIEMADKAGMNINSEEYSNLEAIYGEGIDVNCLVNVCTTDCVYEVRGRQALVDDASTTDGQSQLIAPIRPLVYIFTGQGYWSLLEHRNIMGAPETELDEVGPDHGLAVVGRWRKEWA